MTGVNVEAICNFLNHGFSGGGSYADSLEYLTDLIRFLEYETERRPEGGSSALIRMVHAFAAAGIANRIVAVFDNDAAATDCLRSFKSDNLPAQIQVIRYPDLDFGRSYPTLGPPTVASPLGAIAHANINGLAASIEVY
jgi:hypothetical protein